MHIGVLATSWPHASEPIAGSFVYALTSAMVARGHRATVLFAAHPRSSPARCDGCELVPLRYAPSARSLFYDAGAPSRLREAPILSTTIGLAFSARMLAAARVRLAGCDALVSHFALPSSLVAGLVRGDRPHHAIVHGSDARILARAPASIQRTIARRATSLQFAHPGLRASLVDELSAHASSSDLPMAVTAPSDAARARWRMERRAELAIDEDVVLIVCVSRLSPEKGVAALVRAARALDSRRAQMIIVGDGPERRSLEREAPACVRFVGAVASDERDRWLAAADVFALASVSDSAPTAIVEALAFELPIVATRVGGIPWLVGDAARLVDAQDTAALNRELAAFVESPALRREYQRRAAARSQTLPSWDGLAAHILQSVGATQ